MPFFNKLKKYFKFYILITFNFQYSYFPYIQETQVGLGGLSDSNRDFSNPMYDMQSGRQEPVPSHVSQSNIGVHRELNPVTIDTGKDTQCLVEDDSEC